MAATRRTCSRARWTARAAVSAAALVAVAAACAAAASTPSARISPAGPNGTPAKVRPAVSGIWISRKELLRLPTSGRAWEKLKATADGDLGEAKLADQNSSHDTNTLAAALVYARTGDPYYGRKAADAIVSAIGTEEGGETLALGRNLAAYVIAADVVDLRTFDAAAEQTFRTWLAAVRTKRMKNGEGLVQTHTRANNWGTHAGASLAAANAYLGDAKALAAVARIFKGWTGDRDSFKFTRWSKKSDTWAPNPDGLVPVNPAGATVEGTPVGGALISEQSRCGKFRWPPCKTQYPWGALGGALVQATILHRQGYDAFNWGDQALRRATQFLYDLSLVERYWWKPARKGDDSWQPWLVNAAYGTQFPATTPTTPGKPMGWTDWTHARRLLPLIAQPPRVR